MDLDDFSLIWSDSVGFGRIVFNLVCPYSNLLKNLNPVCVPFTCRYVLIRFAEFLRKPFKTTNPSDRTENEELVLKNVVNFVECIRDYWYDLLQLIVQKGVWCPT